MEKTNKKNKDPTTPSGGERRKSSIIEQEYMFGTISQEKPLSRPTPSGKLSQADLTGEEDPGVNEGWIAHMKRIIVPREQLYKEAVYTGFHYLGCPSPVRFPVSQEEICLYTHEIFSESDQETEEVLNFVVNEPFPLTVINCKLKKASGLQGPKANDGFVDPYCIVTIETEESNLVFQLDRLEWEDISKENLAARKEHVKAINLRPPAEIRKDQVYSKVPEHIKTSVQRRNKDPKWDQRFQCLSLRPSGDRLIVEVWDQSMDGKSPDIFLGKVSIRISDIPCDGNDHWYYLTGTPHTKNKTTYGKVRIQIWLIHAYRHGVNFTEVTEPKVMLSHLWDWIIDKEEAKYYDNNNDKSSKWDGTVPLAATCLVFQYALQNGISEDTHAIIRWNAYAEHDLRLGDNRIDELQEVMDKNILRNGELHSRIQNPQQDVEENILAIVRDRICPIIRNHLNETAESVHDALRSYQNCLQVVKTYKNTPLLEKLALLVHGAIRLGVLEWYQQMHASHVPNHGEVEKGQYVSCVVQVMREVNALLRLGEIKWSPDFWLMASIEYLPTIYDELQKMVIHDIEAICWLFFQFQREFRKLRKILLTNDEKDRVLCNSFFDLYKQAQIFVFAQVDIHKGAVEYPFLDSYHRWFRPILVLWLGFALIRGSLVIYKTIGIDNNVQDDAHTMTSSSALDTANVLGQLATFWTTLQWPDVGEGYVVINFLMEVVCSYAILYAQLKHSKLEKEGYYDPNGQQFTISERLCTALNNIEHVKEQVEIIPKDIDYELLIKNLEATCGKSKHVIWYENRAQERLEKTLQAVNAHIDAILANVGLRIEKETSPLIQQSFATLIKTKSNQLNEAMDPIIAYLEKNIVVLQKALHPRNFHKLLQLLWNLVCIGLHNQALSLEMNSTKEQISFFKRITDVIPYLQHYFEGGDAGLTMAEMHTPDFDDLSDLFNCFTMQTDDLILTYYQTTAQYHLKYKAEAKIGTLQVRIEYRNGKLEIEVISAFDLTAHDQDMTFLKYFHKFHPTSDSMVEVELRPAVYFPNEKKYSTKVRWKELNPVFEESFSWSITAADCKKESAVVVFTVKDYDLLTKNAFLGEAIIPLNSIPGIAEMPERQPMKLTLLEVEKVNHALLVLNTRKWDATAQQFSNEQLGKFVEPVVKKK